MPKICILTHIYTELWKEYLYFLQKNNIFESDVANVYFIYYDKSFNIHCLNANDKLTKEECHMYDLTVDDDCNYILTDNNLGTIYVKLTNGFVFAFRSTNHCLYSKNYRFLNEWYINENNIKKSHLVLLKKYPFF